jgi:hypothetical protein
MPARHQVAGLEYLTMERRQFIRACTGALLAATLPVTARLLLAESEPPALSADSIYEILDRMTGVGSFSQTVVRADGVSVTYSFPWAVGMGLLHYQAQYRKQFASGTPDWAGLEHPYHAFVLAKRAVELNLPLPAVLPQRPRRIG